MSNNGPLKGYTVLEMAGIGPGPFCAMMLADMGAKVIRIDRKTPGFLGGGGTIVDRGRKTIALDLKAPGAIEVVTDLVQQVDVLIEGYRPGVAERLGLGPDVCLSLNPKLIYGRMTGWGQDGPLAHSAGHDINYIAITGALHAMGYEDRPPTPPLHLLGDLGGGAMMLAFGIVCALLETKKSGKGQVIDAAISDGVANLASAYHHMLKVGRWENTRYNNMLDGAAHFYGCYRCADGKFVSIGAIEPQFYELLLELCGIQDPDFQDQWDKKQWPKLRAKLEMLFGQKTRDEWCQILEGSDACFAPVLDFEEAKNYPHNQARQTFITTDDLTHPAPTPKFSRSQPKAGPIPKPGAHTEQILKAIGRSPAEIMQLRKDGAIS